MSIEEPTRVDACHRANSKFPANLQPHDGHRWSWSNDEGAVWCPGWKPASVPPLNLGERAYAARRWGSDLDYIIGPLIEEFAKKMAADAEEYGRFAHRDLGTRGQFSDLHRKMIKLRRAMWDGVDTSAWREQPREILLDLMGHCALAIAMMDREGADSGAEGDAG
jgi:hypothetical protein